MVNLPINFTANLTIMSMPSNGTGQDSYLIGNMVGIEGFGKIKIRSVRVVQNEGSTTVKAHSLRAHVIAVGW